jgi:Arc/MetJ-type ribon-helix-helix transcriptional regulator
MEELETITVTLHAEVAAQVRRAVSAGEYRNASEAVEDALLHWGNERNPLDTLEHLRTAWRQAENDTRQALEPAPVFARLRKQFAPESEESSQ